MGKTGWLKARVTQVNKISRTYALFFEDDQDQVDAWPERAVRYRSDKIGLPNYIGRWLKLNFNDGQQPFYAQIDSMQDKKHPLPYHVKGWGGFQMDGWVKIMCMGHYDEHGNR